MHHPADRVPAAAARRRMDAERAQQLGRGFRQRLPGRVARRVIDRKFRPYPVLDPHAIRPRLPAGGVQQGGGGLGVVFHLVVRSRPDEAVDRAEGRGAMAEQRHVDHDIAVDAEVHCPADRRIRRHRIADAAPVLFPRLGKRQAQAAIVDGLHRQGVKSVRHGIGERGRDGDHIHRSGMGGGEPRIFAGEQEGDALERARGAVVMLVPLDDQLLALGPGQEAIGPGPDRRAGVIRPVGPFGHDAEGQEILGEGDPGPRQRDADRAVVQRLGPLHHLEIHHPGSRLCGVEGEGHVPGRQRCAVGEPHIVAQRDRPGLAVVGKLPVGGQVRLDLQRRIAPKQGGLEQRVAIGAPSEDRVEPGFRLAADRQSQRLAPRARGRRLKPRHGKNGREQKAGDAKALSPRMSHGGSLPYADPSGNAYRCPDTGRNYQNG